MVNGRIEQSPQLLWIAGSRLNLLSQDLQRNHLVIHLSSVLHLCTRGIQTRIYLRRSYVKEPVLGPPVARIVCVIIDLWPREMQLDSPHKFVEIDFECAWLTLFVPVLTISPE